MALSPPIAPPAKSKRRRRVPLSIPAEIQAKIRTFAEQLNQEHGDAFQDPKMRNRVVGALRRHLPPRPKPRGYPEVTRAIRMLDELRDLHPDESCRSSWQRIYATVIPNYGALGDLEKLAARQELRERVRWRRLQARRRARKRRTT
jgi:hypothetical protein